MLLSIPSEARDDVVLYRFSQLLQGGVLIQADPMNSEVDTVGTIVDRNTKFDLIFSLLEDCKTGIELLKRAS